MKPATWARLLPLAQALGRLAGLKSSRMADWLLERYRRSLAAHPPTPAPRDRILVLLPRCLQREGCACEVTRDMAACRRCGQCDIASLSALAEANGLKMAVATGGHLALELIRTFRPAGIIAIACAKELLEGLTAAGEDAPVFAILNQQPDGPCHNTRVDVDEVRAALETLLGRPLERPLSL